MLHPFQEIGARFLASKRHAYLADEMGLGKTPQALQALEIAQARRALIIAPAIVTADWLDSYPRFVPSRRPPHDASRIEALPNDRDIVLSYDRAVARRDELRALPPFDVLVADEAHFLKSPGAKRTRVILNPIYGGKHSLSAHAGATWLLSGTPVAVHPAEMWSALRTAGLFEYRYMDFVGRFCTVLQTQWGNRITGARNHEEFRALLKGYMLRRLAKDVLHELPELSTDILPVAASEIDQANPVLPLLRQLDEDAAAAIDAAISAGDFHMQHVPHIASIRRLVGLAKADAVAVQAISELELDDVDKLVIFGWHSDPLAYLVRELAPYNPVLIRGDTPHAKRRSAIRRFQTDPACRVAVCQIKAAGAGITLTAASRLLIAEPSWNPADNAQAVKRIHRIGQMRPCRASFVSLASSSDERVTRVLRQRTQMSAELLNPA